MKNFPKQTLFSVPLGVCYGEVLLYCYSWPINSNYQSVYGISWVWKDKSFLGINFHLLLKLFMNILKKGCRIVPAQSSPVVIKENNSIFIFQDSIRYGSISYFQIQFAIVFACMEPSHLYLWPCSIPVVMCSTKQICHGRFFDMLYATTLN